MSGIGILHADHGTRDGEKESLIRAIAPRVFFIANSDSARRQKCVPALEVMSVFVMSFHVLSGTAIYQVQSGSWCHVRSWRGWTMNIWLVRIAIVRSYLIKVWFFLISLLFFQDRFKNLWPTYIVTATLISYLFFFGIGGFLHVSYCHWSVWIQTFQAVDLYQICTD